MVAIVMFRRRQKPTDLPASRVSSVNSSSYGSLELQNLTPHQTPKNAWSATISPEPDDQKQKNSKNSKDLHYQNLARTGSLSDTRSK